jgi:hypothetical protein
MQKPFCDVTYGSSVVAQSNLLDFKKLPHRKPDNERLFFEEMAKYKSI